MVMKLGLNLRHEFGLISTYKASSLLAVDSLLYVVNLFREITAVYHTEKLKIIVIIVPLKKQGRRKVSEKTLTIIFDI